MRKLISVILIIFIFLLILTSGFKKENNREVNKGETESTIKINLPLINLRDTIVESNTNSISEHVEENKEENKQETETVVETNIEEKCNDKFISATEVVADMETGWNLGNTLDSCDFKRYSPEKSNYQIMAVYQNEYWSGWDASSVMYFDKNGYINLQWEIDSLNSKIDGECGGFSFQLINNVILDTRDLPVKFKVTKAEFIKNDGTIIELIDMLGDYELPIKDSVSEYITADLKDIKELDKAVDVIGGILTLEVSITNYPEIKDADKLKVKFYETLWGNPVTTKAMINKVAKAGFKSVRIPITYYDHMDEQGIIDKEWLVRVNEIVDYVLENNMYCIIDVHHDSGEGSWLKADFNSINEQKNNLENLWMQIAQYFKNYDEKLVFEGFNEILNADGKWSDAGEDSYKAANMLNQQFVDTVRSTGGNNLNRNLLVNTYAAGGSEDILKAFEIPTDSADNHLIVGIHYYSALTEEPNKMDIFFNSINKYFTTKGIPVIIGEFASFSNWNKKNSIAYIERFTRKAKESNISVYWWDKGGQRDINSSQTEPLLNRSNLSWYSMDILNAVISAED